MTSMAPIVYWHRTQMKIYTIRRRFMKNFDTKKYDNLYMISRNTISNDSIMPSFIKRFYCTLQLKILRKRKISNNLFTTFLFCLKKLTQEANCRTCLTRHSLKVASSLRYVRMTHRN